jgi:hypothetical protein
MRRHTAVEQIGTEQMTSHQHRQAVGALAALIAAWQHGHTRHPQEQGKDSATPLPLPGTASDAGRTTC